MQLTLTVVSQEKSEHVLSDTGEKTADQVLLELECLGQSHWNDLFEVHLPGKGVPFVRDHLALGATQNKKYYISVDPYHNVMYFKLGKTFFVHLNRIQENGVEHLQFRAFLEDDFRWCIKLLPESCRWKGERQVNYIEVCEKGLVRAGEFTHDFFNVVMDEEDGDFFPLELVEAIRLCYQPNCYSVGFKCFLDGLFFDPQWARKYLEGVEAEMRARDFKTYLDMASMSIKYQKTQIIVDGVEVSSGADFKGLADFVE